MLFALFVTFNDWVGSNTITRYAYATNDYTCWPYFLQCGKYYFLDALPQGYSQTILYTGFFGLMLLIAYLMYRNDWVLVHMGMLVLWTWKTLVVFVLTYSATGNYDYYDIFFLFVWLFLPHKEYFLRVLFVSLYFFAVTLKIDDGWVLGTYFTSLFTGLPIFGNFLAPVMTNLVIFMQMIGSWFLLSKRKLLQRTALLFFVVFHLYSGVLVEYRYMVTTLPMILILFGLFYRPLPISVDKKSITGWAFLLFLCLLQLSRFLIGPDQKMTLEGNRFGLYMFEANHQCVSHITVYETGQQPQEFEEQSADARKRCDPYRDWFTIQQLCQRTPSIVRVSWQFDHSINGGPFYRIVDVQNACDLSYTFWAHNSWIKTTQENPQIVGYPNQNFYH